ncbi:phage tail protein [Clostridium chrysemydis]|uniref:phage tail protein n=1 Tax=Clostridium chrysemydis TaxID=2665504 RepID=UPI0018842C8E|nr:hypothetical protein [Clostridium chrysemydis]
MDLSAIKINVQADTKEASSNLDKLKKNGESLSKIGTGLTLGLTVPIVAFAGASVKAADALRQTQRKSEVIFGEMTKDVQKWALENERTFGLGAGTIEGFTGKIADLTQGMGLGKKESFEMAKGAMELGVQLGNWNGVSADVAMSDLTSAIAGSHKAMEKYGVKLNQTVLDEQTRKMGLGDTFNKLKESEKAQVRYNAIIGASGNAIDFWNKGNRSTAFYMNEIKEQIGNVMEVLGQVFLPVLDKVVKKVADWTSNLAKVVSENPELVKAVVAIGGALAGLGPALLIVGKVMTLCASFPALIPVFGAVAGAIGLLGLSFLGTNEKAQKFITELPSKIFDGLNKMLENITAKLPEMTAKGLEIVNNLLNGVVLGFPILINFVGEMIVGLLNTFFTYMPNFLLTGIDFIVNILNGAVLKFPELVSGVIDSITNLLFKLWEKMPTFLQTGFDFVKNMLDGFIQKFPTLLQNMIDGVLKILAKIREKMPEFMKNGLEFVAKMISGIARNLPSIISKMGELVAKLIGKLVENLPRFLSEGGKMVLQMIKGLWNNKGKLLSIGKDLIKALWDSMVAGVKSFLNIGTKIVEGIKNGISNAWGSFTSWVGSKIKSIPIIGSFLSVSPEEGSEGIEAVPAGYGISAMSTYTRNPFASLSGAFGGVIKTRDEILTRERKDTDKAIENKTLNLTLNIDKFTNNREIDIEELTEEIAFNLQRKVAF